MTLSRCFLVMTFALAAGGCVQVDPHFVGQSVARTMPQAISGTWKARAVYHSHIEFAAADDLADALDLPGSEADEAVISYASDRGLTIRFTRQGEPIFQPTTYTPADGLHLGEDGAIELPFFACSEEDMRLACGKHRHLFVNTKGQLVFAECAGGAGFIAWAPVALYVKLMSKYVRAPVVESAPAASAPE